MESLRMVYKLQTQQIVHSGKPDACILGHMMAMEIQWVNKLNSEAVS